MQGLQPQPYPYLVILVLLFAAIQPAMAQDASPLASVESSMVGATIQDVTIETYGAIKPEIARRYLSLQAGDRLEQPGIDRDSANLTKLAGTIPRLEIDPGTEPNTATLHWIIMRKQLEPSRLPFYGDQPLSVPIQGVGFNLFGPPMNSRGSHLALFTQLSRRANLFRLISVNPVAINPDKGRETDMLFDVQGGRGVYRASQPLAINIYSWNMSAEALLYVHGINNNQLQLGVRTIRSTTAEPTGIVAPSLYSTSQHPARATLLVGGYSHNCGVPPQKWQPPFCLYQYRFQVSDAIGGLGATSEYQSYIADIARYFTIGNSALALHAVEARTGGVIPDSFLVCGNAIRAYPKAFCGTDAQNFQAEYRIGQAVPAPIHFVVFTETSGSRVRGGTQSFAPPIFVWHPDSGVGFIYHTIRFDFAWGNQGGRFSVELQGQTF